MDLQKMEQTGRKMRRAGAWLTAIVWGPVLAVLLLNPIGLTLAAVVGLFAFLVYWGKRAEAKSNVTMKAGDLD